MSKLYFRCGTLFDNLNPSTEAIAMLSDQNGKLTGEFAVEAETRYPGLKKMLKDWFKGRENDTPGDCAFFRVNGQAIFILVCQGGSSGNVEFETVAAAVEALRDSIVKHPFAKLRVPSFWGGERATYENLWDMTLSRLRSRIPEKPGRRIETWGLPQPPGK